MMRAAPMRRRIAGTSLIEVMVTMLLLAVSTLSTASLLVASKRSAYDATQRSIASQLTGDISQRMRSNGEARNSYFTPNGGIGNNVLNNTACTSNNPCSSAQLAAFELAEWEDHIRGTTETRTVGGNVNATGGLASPRACVTGPALGGSGMYTIAVAWRGSVPLSNPVSHDCGSASGLYGANNEFRRIVVLNVFMS